MPYSKVNNLKIFFYENKIEGIPLLFIHGWLGSSGEWAYQLSYFNSKKHILILDLPGFGRSDKPKTNYSIEFFTEQIISFLNLKKLHKVHLIGHSLGGLIAQNIAFLYPDIVSKLILINSPYTAFYSSKEKITLFFLNILFKLMYRRILKEIIKRITDPNTERKEFRKLLKNAFKLPKAVVLSSFKNMNKKFGPKDMLQRISQPTLLILGSNDKIVPQSMIHKLHNALALSQVIVIESNSHRVMFQNHEKTNKLIEEFINI